MYYVPGNVLCNVLCDVLCNVLCNVLCAQSTRTSLCPRTGCSPVTKGVLVSTLVASAVLRVKDPGGKFNVTLGEFGMPGGKVSAEGVLGDWDIVFTTCTAAKQITLRVPGTAVV